MSETLRTIRPAAVAAWHQLGGVLIDLRDQGAIVPCQADPAPFTSEDYRERAEAAQACQWCPALAACGRFADDQRESTFVWAGRDRSPRPKRTEPKGDRPVSTDTEPTTTGEGGSELQGPGCEPSPLATLLSPNRDARRRDGKDTL